VEIWGPTPFGYVVDLTLVTFPCVSHFYRAKFVGSVAALPIAELLILCCG